MDTQKIVLIVDGFENEKDVDNLLFAIHEYAEKHGLNVVGTSQSDKEDDNG